MSRQPVPEDRDYQVYGPDTSYEMVRATRDDGREWLKGDAICPLLAHHHIAHVGVMTASAPFEILRTQQGGTFMIACLGGEGVVQIDGSWKRVRTGQACILPPFCQNAFKCVPNIPWNYAWVRYDESREVAPIVSGHSPVVGSFHGRALHAAILGLHAEVTGKNGPSALHHWVELIHHYVLGFAQPHAPESRLWRLWNEVQADLARPWKLSDLAKIACMSGEHLRRTCQREIGRSPMQHLTFLRLQRAAHLLSVTNDKMEVIAREVGFESSFTFSNSFKTFFGWRPSDHRKRS